MTSLNVAGMIQAGWKSVCGKVKRAVVFMDSACAESLHWNGGAMLLIQAGADNIKEFSSFESAGPNEKKAVFIISGPLSGLNKEILRDIVQASQLEYVVVISSLTPSMHTLVEMGGTEQHDAAFQQLQEQLLEWMGNMNYTTEVLYIPLTFALITPHLFVLPEHSDLFPLLPSDIKQLKRFHKKDHGQELLELEFVNLPKEAQLQFKLLVCSLNALMEQLGVSEDCYALGSTSKVVASELASLTWARTRRKSAKNKASLLVIDRSLDLVGGIGHHSETLLDRVLAVLPRLAGHHNDIQVNMAPICSIPSDAEDVIMPGCLSHTMDTSATNLLSTLASRKHKECLMEVNRQLIEAASNAGLPIKLTGRPGHINAEQLQSTISLFKGKMAVIRKYSGILQICQGAAEALCHPAMRKHDSLLATEKGFIQCLADEESPSLLSQITRSLNKDMSKTRDNRTHSIEDVFCLLMFIYSLLENESEIDAEEEQILQSSLIESILIESLEDLPVFLQQLLGEQKTADKVAKVLEEIFKKFRGLASAREHLTMFRSLHDDGGVMSVATLKPLLQQATEAIFDPTKPELPDITFKSTGFRDLLKSGFGLFMNVSKPRPSDHPLLVIFVIGGITANEVKQIKDTITSAKSTVQVLVGSTSLLKPQDLLQRVLVQNNLYPTTSVL